MTTDIDWDYGEVDQTNVNVALTNSSAKYDKAAPGAGEAKGNWKF
jgi:hypothetical protein